MRAVIVPPSRIRTGLRRFARGVGAAPLLAAPFLSAAIPLQPSAASVIVPADVREFRINGWEFECTLLRTGNRVDHVVDCEGSLETAESRVVLRVGEEYVATFVGGKCADAHQARRWPKRAFVAEDATPVLIRDINAARAACRVEPVRPQFEGDVHGVLVLIVQSVSTRNP